MAYPRLALDPTSGVVRYLEYVLAACVTTT
jgi:hypothetical protein